MSTVHINSVNVVQTLFGSSTVNANTTSADSTIINLSQAYAKNLAFCLTGTYATTSATTGLRLSVYYSPDSSAWDTDAYAIMEPTFTSSSTGSQTRQKTRPITAIPGYYKCTVTNLDASINATAVKVTSIRQD